MAATILERVHKLFSRRAKRARDMKEIDLIGGREFSDLGLSRSEVRALATGTDVRERLEGMTTRLGLSYAELMEPHWRAVDVARTCVNCRQRRACRRFLAGHGARDEYREFCPNAAAFATLKKITRN